MQLMNTLKKLVTLTEIVRILIKDPDIVIVPT